MVHQLLAKNLAIFFVFQFSQNCKESAFFPPLLKERFEISAGI